MEIVQTRLRKFTEDRDWDQFHSPANIAKSIIIEAAELLEHFQWNDEDYDLAQVQEELADVLLYCLQLANKLSLDPIAIMHDKMTKNERKYPVDQSYGSSKKYTELE